MHDCLEEARKLLNGDQALGDRLRDLATFFCIAWAEAHSGGKYAWGPEAPKNAQLLKRLCAAESNNTEIERRIIAYMQDDDRYVVEHKHAFGLFFTRYNQYVITQHTGLESR